MRRKLHVDGKFYRHMIIDKYVHARVLLQIWDHVSKKSRSVQEGNFINTAYSIPTVISIHVVYIHYNEMLSTFVENSAYVLLLMLAIKR